MSLIDLMTMAKSNKELQKKILSRLWEFHPDKCFQCMRCTSGCTALKLLELKPHEIMKLVGLGLGDDLVASDVIWTCATCLKCTQRCPQKTSPYHVIMALRSLAVEREATVPEAYLKAVSQILENGLSKTIQKITTHKMETFDRTSLKLPEISTPQESFQTVFLKALEEKQA